MSKKNLEVSYGQALLLYLIKWRPLQIAFVLTVLALLARWAVE